MNLKASSSSSLFLTVKLFLWNAFIFKNSLNSTDRFLASTENCLVSAKSSSSIIKRTFQCTMMFSLKFQTLDLHSQGSHDALQLVKCQDSIPICVKYHEQLLEIQDLFGCKAPLWILLRIKQQNMNELNIFLHSQITL